MNAPPSAKTQRARILRVLVDAHGAWVPLPEIMACAAQYNARVWELRRLGFNIENKTECVDGVRQSWFRLVNAPASHELESPKLAGSSEKPISHTTRHERASQFEREFGKPSLPKTAGKSKEPGDLFAGVSQ